MPVPACKGEWLVSFSIKVKKTNINYAKILKQRGLGSNNKARLFLASEVARLSDPYVPMQIGNLKNNRIIAPDGRSIKYTQRYAKKQYNGVSASGRPLRYNHAPMRGKEWDKRMMADHSKDIEQNLAKFVGGKTK